MPKNTVHTGASIEGPDGETEMLGAATIGQPKIGEATGEPNEAVAADADDTGHDDETPKKAAPRKQAPKKSTNTSA
jgi:hypothetical protein